MRVAAIITVKRLGEAKKRLAEAVGPATRRALAEAMLFDVLGAARRAQSLERLLVVTGDSTAREIAASFGIEVLDDQADEGQSAAALIGIARALELDCEAIVLLPGDCPMLSNSELDELVGGATPGSVIVVPDRHGTGTNALLLSPPDAIDPAFGEGSCERHVELARRAGLQARVEQLASLALDLDTPEDLAALAEAFEASRGAGRTRGLLRQIDRVALG